MGNRKRRGDDGVTAAEWSAAVQRQPLDRVTRLVAGALAEHADRHGRVRTTVGALSDCCCLPVTAVADALAAIASHGLLGRDGPRVLVLALPDGGAG